MKMIKKLVVGALSLALLVSGFAFAASADGATVDEDYASILEYYSQPFFTLEDFDDVAAGNYTAGVLNAASKTTAQFATVVKDGDNSYLKLQTGELGSGGTLSGNMGLGWVGDKAGTGFLADFDIHAEHNGSAQYTCRATNPSTNRACNTKVVVAKGEDMPTTCAKCGLPFDNYELTAGLEHPIVRFYVHNADDNTPKSIAGTEIVVLDFNAKTVSYLSANGELKVIEGFELNPATWYKVSIVYNGTSFSVKVTDAADATKTVEKTDGVSPVKTVKSVRIGTIKKENPGQYISFDNLDITGGTFRRDDANKQTITEQWILDSRDLCADPEFSVDDKQIIIETYNSLVNLYDFTSTVPEVVEALNDLKNFSITVYADQLVACVKNINYEGGYEVRLANVTLYSRFFKKIPADISGLDEQNKAYVEKALLDYNTEVAAVEKLKSDSEDFIRISSTIDLTVEDYVQLNAMLDNLNTVEPDPTYNGVAGAMVIKDSLVSKIENIESKGGNFILAVTNMKEKEVFSDQYAAYLTAKAGYFDNETYPGITEALADYETYSAPIVAVETVCKEYILWVDRANFATYINAKEENLNKADLLTDLEPTFPGLAEAQELYTTLRAFIAEKKEAVADYIAAVAALEGKTGAELEAAIANAKALQEAGNVAGFEGVTDANIALSNAVASVELCVAQSKQFVTLVSRIASAKDIAARFEAITAAKRMAGKATDSHDGVAKAKNDLAAAITQYNADVNAVNDAYVSVTKDATDMFISVVQSNTADAITSKVVAFIKKLFD